MTDAGENIATLLTPPGAAAIAVVRLIGPLNNAFAATHVSRPAKVGRCVHADLRDGDTTIDDIVIVQAADGLLDLNLHGGPWVVEATLRLAGRFGYVTQKWPTVDAAFDTTDAIEWQMFRDLPGVKSLIVLRLLAAQPALWRAMLADEDRAAMRQAIDDRTLQVALAVPRVAIVGPPNVGKSTLANALFAIERSITADRPGTTRDWVGELADLAGLTVMLIDTPGVRATDDPIEAAAIDQATNVVAAAQAVIVAVDGSRPLDDEARAMLRRHDAAIVVRTKADQPSACVDIDGAIDVSAPLGVGLSSLIAAVHRSLGVNDLEHSRPMCWTDDQRADLRHRLGDGGAFI